ncbi:MAG: hypothetical protein FJ100_08865 [Deltaproteobacteria bacterium]|nr:hypothetical protein [Deltaproteobacteria bacterium]
MYEGLTLDDLAIRGSSHTPFFGIYLASHAVRDAMCMCHASVGCKVKTQEHLVYHDGVQDAHNRRRYSQLIDEDLIQGSTAQLEEEIVAFAARLGSQVVVIDCSTPLSLQVQPLKGVVERCRQRTGVDVVAVSARNYDNDLWFGYAATAAALFRRQFEVAAQLDPPTVAADEVSLLGMPFDRYEGDSQGNVAEVRRLLWGLGLKAKAVFFAGEPYATLADAVRARTHLSLPWMAPALREVRQVAEVAALPVPMGFDGTRRFVLAAAQASGVSSQRAVSFCQAELAAAKPLAELARRALRGRHYVAFAEAPRLAGLIALCSELEMVPLALGVTHFRLGGRADVQAMLAREFDVCVADHVVWLEDPTPQAVAALGPAQGGAPALLDRADLVVGSSIERDQLAEYAGPFLEFGFPSEARHYLLPAPWLGFRGALRLAEQMMQAVVARGGR